MARVVRYKDKENKTNRIELTLNVNNAYGFFYTRRNETI